MNRFRLRVRELGKEELKHLPSLLFTMKLELEKSLAINQRRLFYLSPDNNKRLLVLRNWSERYKVPVGYILNVLIPYYAERFKKERRKEQKGLPVSIATLTGKASEFILKQRLEKEFPDREQLELWRQQKQQEILLERDARINGVDEFMPRHKTLLDYEWVSQWVRQYRKKATIQRRQNRREAANPQNKARNYRGNPFG